MHWLSGITALLAIWLGISPWVFGYSGNVGATTSAIIVGGVVLVLAAIRFFVGFAAPGSTAYSRWFSGSL